MSDYRGDLGLMLFGVFAMIFFTFPLMGIDVVHKSTESKENKQNSQEVSEKTINLATNNTVKQTGNNPKIDFVIINKETGENYFTTENSVFRNKDGSCISFLNIQKKKQEALCNVRFKTMKMVEAN